MRWVREEDDEAATRVENIISGVRPGSARTVCGGCRSREWGESQPIAWGKVVNVWTRMTERFRKLFNECIEDERN